MTKLKYHDFDLQKVAEDEILISFKVKNLRGVDLIEKAFQAGKDLVEGSISSGVYGLVSIAFEVYNWIKAGKKAL